MRDGFDAYYRPGGGQDEALDYSLVAYVENQALLYEALTLAALELFPDDPDAPEWLAAAASVRAGTLKQFWIEDWQMFCPAVDRRGPVALHSTAAAELLNGPFLDDIPDAPDYVRTIVEWLYSPAVMTPIGPRMLSLCHAADEGDYYGYQGTGAVWSVTNGIVAKGLGHWTNLRGPGHGHPTPVSPRQRLPSSNPNRSTLGCASPLWPQPQVSDHI